jgi:hypothetical protein
VNGARGEGMPAARAVGQDSRYFAGGQSRE